jgi:hypothetical protein
MRLLPLLLIPALVSAAENFQPPAKLCSPATTGAHPRTLHLLRSSTAAKPNSVRILFYGQSITEQHWTKDVTAGLKQQFPHAQITTENRAIGGHSSQLLYKTAEADLYPFSPDLVIFHVYGNHLNYETLIRRIRERTSAEVILQTDHLSAHHKLDEPTDAATLTMKDWDAWMNYSHLPSVAKKYGAELLDQRNLWKAYLQQTDASPQSLLKDSVHLNDHGCKLMAAIVLSAFQGTAPAATPGWQELVTTQSVTPGSVVKFSFEGTRLDADLPMPNAKVLIDGKSPESIRSCWTFTRSSGYNGTNWPCLLQVQRGPADLQDEAWEIRIKTSNEDYSEFTFEVKGSLTGEDGNGSAKERFVSKSGKLVIEPEDWNLAYSFKVFKKKLPEDFVIRFRSQLQKAEPTTLVQGLPNGKHTVEITPADNLKAVRVFKPALKATEELAPNRAAAPAK